MKRLALLAALAAILLPAGEKPLRTAYIGEDVSAAGAPATPFSITLPTPQVAFMITEDGTLTVFIGAVVPGSGGMRIRRVKEVR
jgi:hypothetical protein